VPEKRARPDFFFFLKFFKDLITVAANTFRPSWGIASVRQMTDFTPGYIADRSCREELLDLSDMMRRLHSSVDNCYF
jgi:hypothetical protein